MNHIFSFHRIKLLAIRYFFELGRRDLFNMCAFFIAFVLLPHIVNDASNTFNPVLFGIILFIGGMRFTARIFHEIHQPAPGMHYLHIPASRLEKYLFNGLLTLILYPAICILLYYGGVYFGNLLEPIIPSFFNYQIIDISTLIPGIYVKKIASQYVIMHSIFFLGSLSFKKHPTTKTFLSIITFAIGAGIIQAILTRMLWANVDGHSMDLLNNKVRQLIISWPRIEPYLNSVLSGVIVLFFWAVSYLKLKEKQV